MIMQLWEITATFIFDTGVPIQAAYLFLQQNYNFGMGAVITPPGS